MILPLFILFYFFNISIFAQALQTEWVRPIPGNLYEQNNGLAQTPCGDLYAGGFFQNNFGGLTAWGAEDGYISKYNEQGQLIWLKQLRCNNADRVNSIAVSNDHEIYITGEFRGSFYYNSDSLVSQDRLDIFIAKIDSSGNILWAKQGAGWGFQSANAITTAPNGTISISGYYEDTLHFENLWVHRIGLRDIFVANFDNLGNLLWLQSLGGPAFEDGKAIISDNVNNFYITGPFRDFLFVFNDTLVGNGVNDVFIAKYNSNGVLQWVKTMGGPAADEATCLNINQNQQIFVGGWYDRSMEIGHFSLQGNSEEDGFVVTLDTAGNFLWAEPLAGDFDERIYAIDFDENNNFYVTGTLDSLMVLFGDSLTNRHLNRPTDIFITKFSENRTYHWGQTLGHYYNDFAKNLIVKNSSTLYLSGGFQDTSIFVLDTIIADNQYDVFVAKFAIDTTVAIHQLPDLQKKDIFDLEFFPNPCTTQSTLSYYLKDDSAVKIMLWNALGQDCGFILNKSQPSGQQEITIQKPQNANGVYFLSLSTPQSQVFLKIIFD